jgi:transcriptional regulator with XRE-family HTH domain
MHKVDMTLSDYLDAQGLTDAEFAARVGLRSHSTINRLKRGVAETSVHLALQIEAATGGAVDASTLSSDVRKVREAGGLMPHAEDICTPATPLSGGMAGDLAPLPQAPPQGAPQLAGAEPSSAPAAQTVSEIRPPASAQPSAPGATPDLSAASAVGVGADAEGGADATQFEEREVICALCDAAASPGCRNRGCPHTKRGAR